MTVSRGLWGNNKCSLLVVVIVIIVMVAAAAVLVYRYDTKYFGRGDLQEFINSS